MTSLACNKEEYYTYADYMTWTEGRWEVIDGVVYDMTPAPLRIHQEILGTLFFKFREFLNKSDCKVYVAPFDVRLSETAEAEDAAIDTVVQPDIVVVCDKEKLDERGCLGAPELIVEVLSPSTASYDLKVKRALYEKHGVAEYWLFHPTDQMAMVYRLDAQGQYGKAEIYAMEDELHSSLFEELIISLSDIFQE